MTAAQMNILIEGINKVTENALKSKESALKLLEEAGILELCPDVSEKDQEKK